MYRIRNPVSHYINVSNVAQLHSMVEAGGTVVLGANNSLSATMEFFYKKASEKPLQFGYLQSLADHIDLIANVPVRNVSSRSYYYQTSDVVNYTGCPITIPPSLALISKRLILKLDTALA